MRCYVTTPAQPWRETTHAELAAAARAPAAPPPVGVPLRSAGAAAQTLLGFGGCFNEIGARDFQRLPAGEQARLLAGLFGDDGCHFDLCRLPIGASDYALSWYSYADTPDDYALAHFSIERDRRHLLPFIHAAQAARPGLRFSASPWSPPSWLKELDRYNGSRLRDEPRVWATYADYLLSYLRAYRDAGVAVSQLHIQNEPNSDQKFPSCLWTGASMRDFIRDHLGPRFEAAGEPCELWAGTIERGALVGWQPEAHAGDCYHNWLHTILADPAARRHIKGVGYQWNGKGALAQTRAEWPDLPIMQTENECGDGQNTWAYAFYVFDLMWQYFHHGCSAYVYWNFLLPAGGQSTWGWRQNALATVDAVAGTFHWNPEYHVLRHVAQFVRPGARYLPLRGGQAAYALAFENPDGATVLILANPAASPTTVDLALPHLQGPITLPAQSLTTWA
jgi:glucosylceramidase